MADMNDGGFIERLGKLLGIDREKAEEMLDKLDGDALLTLTDAVAKNDASAAKRILAPHGMEEGDVPAAAEEASDEDAEVVKHGRRKKRSGDEEPSDGIVEFGVGDAVEVNGDDAIVKIPHGPGGTVGVLIGGKLKMIDRKKVRPVGDALKLDEMVLGMTGIPSIQRMQELAGISTASFEAPETSPVQVAVGAAEPDNSEGGDANSPECAKAAVMACLDELERHMPNLRVADLKDVRKRIYDLTARLNEGRSLRREGKTRV